MTNPTLSSSPACYTRLLIPRQWFAMARSFCRKSYQSPLCQRSNRFSNRCSKTRSFKSIFVNSTPIPSPGTILRTIASACTFPPGTSNESLSFVPTGGGLGTEMNRPPMPSVRTREKSCRSPPCQATYMPFGNEMGRYLRFGGMASSVVSCTLPGVTEALARLAKTFDPGEQCCIGVSINVQKFEAHSRLWFHDADHSQHLYFLALVRQRRADPVADLQGATRTHITSSKRK